MEGERILKSLLNGETDGLYEDTKNYLSPLQSSLKNKNSCKIGTKAAEGTIPKYIVFCAKFLRCAVETLKKVKAKGDSLDEVTKSLKLVGDLLNSTLSSHNGNFLKFIPSLDQLGKTIYLIVVQLIGKGEFDRALGHASDLLKFIQLLKTWNNYDSEKMDKELASLALRTSDVLLQGAGKLEELKISPAQKASHLCIVLEWRRLSLLFQVEAISHSSLKSVVERTLKCGTKYQVDSGQKNINFKSLASFFESIFNAILPKINQLVSTGIDSLLLLVELGFHYGRICIKAGSSMQALDVFDKLLDISGNNGHCKNGHTVTKLPLSVQVCCCVCLVCKAAISLHSANAKSQTQEAYQQLLYKSHQQLSQVLKCKILPSSTLKLLSDALEFFRITLQNVCSKQTGVTKEKPSSLSWRTFQGTELLLQSYVAVLSLQCERLKAELRKVNSDDSVMTQLRQQLQKTTDRQLGVLSFLITSYQDQLKSDKDVKNCNKESRSHIMKGCVSVAQEASTLIHTALDDPDIPVSPNELRWLGCNVYNLGCVSYQRDCFTEGVPLLRIACDELRVWCFSAEAAEEVLTRTEEVKLLTKFALLTDCQRRARQLRDALKTAATQVLISARTSCDAVIIRQQIKQWTTVKHDLVKSLQDEEKQVERSRTLCSALAQQQDAEDIVSDQLCLVLQEELACYKVKSYDTAVEQVAVIKQLMELYIVQEDEFQYGSSMLELAVTLYSLGSELEDDRSALDYCQKAAAILEQVSDKVASADEEEGFYSSVVQDRVAAAYLWQALLEHAAVMEEKQTEQSSELSESFEADELEGICMEQGFVSSLHSALETWTVLVSRSVQKEADGKSDLRHFTNPEETCHYLLITAGMFSLVNQPLKKVCALFLAGIISQAIGTTSTLDNGVSAFTDAVHTLCEVLDIHHACTLLHKAGEMLDSFESSATTKVQFLLAKSHHLLITGKYSEGEDCLKEILQSDVHIQKSYKSHLLKAKFKCLCAKYSMLPTKQHMFSFPLDPVLGSLTALECAMDGFHKLSHMAEEVFGEDVFSGGKKKLRRETVSGEGPLVASNNSQSVFHLSLLDDLLSSLLHVGQLYAHQGAVREAFRQFVDGIALARHFALSYRIAEFLVNISQLELKQGKTDKCQNRLEQLKGVLQPVLKSSGEAELFEERIEEALFIGHPESCECVSCGDLALHAILINYFMSLSKYLPSVSRHEQGNHYLDMTETVCECTQKKMVKSLERLDVILRMCCIGAVESTVQDARKKGRTKSSKGRKQKGDVAVKNLLPQLMFSQHQVSLCCMKAQLMLQSGNVKKANDELSRAMEILHCVEGVVGNGPVYLLTEKATLLYLSGVVAMMSNNGRPGKVHTDHNWFAKDPVEKVSGEDTVAVMDSVKGDSAEDEIEKPRKGSSRRGKGSKPTEKTCVKDTSKPKSTTAKGRGRKKGVEETVTECHESDAGVQQKAKGNRKPAKAARAPKDVPDSKTVAPKWVNQAIQYWNEAFDLCQVCPPPALFAGICRGLAFCHGRSAPQLSMYYLNLSSSVTLRHQALTSTGKRIKRTAKQVPVSSLGVNEHSRDVAHLAEGLASLSLNSCTSASINPEIACKLEERVKIRNVMNFNLLSERSAEFSSYPFSREEMALLQKIPKEWTVCTLETFKRLGSEETVLMICRIRAGSEPLLVKINTTEGEEQTRAKGSNDLVMDLTKLFECSLIEEFNDIMSASIKSMSVDSTPEWWAQRTRLDTKMKNFLEKLEASWLGKWKGVLLGQPVDESCQDSTMTIARGLQEKIACLCGCEPDVQLLEVLVSSSSHLSRKEITDAFAEITSMDPTSPSLSQLLHEFEDLTGDLFSCGDNGSHQHRSGSCSEMVSRHPVILILGKDIQHLPWESLPMLYDHPVTRVPSLQFLLSKVSCQMQLTRVDPVKTFYALNPQNNLPNTQKMFQKWFESEHGWQGITGKAPTQEEFSKALTDHEMFIYFGHGTGREFLQGDDIQRLDCRAVTLLMGCSSGKLMVGGECEPRGMVLNYLLAGCPAIVANLWDVTDKDIDRFSDSLLKQWLDPDTRFSLPEVLSQSRQACKLKYLIGASPVLYGLPVYIKT